LRLVVRDDGCGIGSDEPDAGGAAGMGLCSMRARAASIGARLRVRKRPGGGTEVDLSVPSAVAYTAGSPAGE
jgi:signal transduction histidine kinase